MYELVEISINYKDKLEHHCYSDQEIGRFCYESVMKHTIKDDGLFLSFSNDSGSSFKVNLNSVIQYKITDLGD